MQRMADVEQELRDLKRKHSAGDTHANSNISNSTHKRAKH